MGTFKIVKKVELKMRRKLSQEDLFLFDQFKVNISKLNGNEAGIYEFSNAEDHQRRKKLLRKAAKALDIPVRVIEEENALVFYRRKPRTSRSGQSIGTS